MCCTPGKDRMGKTSVRAGQRTSVRRHCARQQGSDPRPPPALARPPSKSRAESRLWTRSAQTRPSRGTSVSTRDENVASLCWACAQENAKFAGKHRFGVRRPFVLVWDFARVTRTAERHCVG
eukprot:3363591-Rhodomonas_salina.1